MINWIKRLFTNNGSEPVKKRRDKDVAPYIGFQKQQGLSSL